MNTMLPVRIDRHFFTRLAVTANDEFDRTAVSGIIANAVVSSSMSVEEVENAPMLACTQVVKLELADKKRIPYSLDVECVGFFVSENGKLDSAVRQNIVRIAHQVLYSAIREMVLTMTGRMAWGPFSIGVAYLKERRPTTAIPAKTSAPKAAKVGSKPVKPKATVKLRSTKIPSKRDLTS